jgi:Tfp pilus assembly protein PilF
MSDIGKSEAKGDLMPTTTARRRAFAPQETRHRKGAGNMAEKAYLAVDMGASSGRLVRLEEVCRFAPKSFEAFWGRASLYDKKGEFDKAFADYDEVVGLDPKQATTYYNRGLAYVKQGMMQELLTGRIRLV